MAYPTGYFLSVYFFSISSLSPTCDDELRLGPRCSGQASSRLPAAVGLPPALPPSSTKATNFNYLITKPNQVLAASQEKEEKYHYKSSIKCLGLWHAITQLFVFKCAKPSKGITQPRVHFPSFIPTNSDPIS